MLETAISRIRPLFDPANWRAFELLWLKDQPAEEVARELAMPVAKVYVAKSRILKRLREEVLELAEDLRHWPRGEPIAARPTGSPERLWRWCRRNPRVAMLSGTVLGLLTMLAAGSTAGFLRIAHAQRETEQQRNAAIAAGERATESANDDDETQRLAEERLAVALDSLNVLIFKVQTQLADTGGTLKVREQLLETAMAGLDRITKDAGKLPAADHSMAVAHQRIGDILWLSGRSADARTHYNQARELAEARLGHEPANVPARRDLATAHEKMGLLAQHAYQLPQAREHYTKALELIRGLDEQGHLTDMMAQAGKRFAERARAALDVVPMSLDDPAVARRRAIYQLTAPIRFAPSTSKR